MPNLPPAKRGTPRDTEHMAGVGTAARGRDAWGQCSCGWLGPVRTGEAVDQAYTDADGHLVATTQ